MVASWGVGQIADCWLLRTLHNFFLLLGFGRGAHLLQGERITEGLTFFFFARFLHLQPFFIFFL